MADDNTNDAAESTAKTEAQMLAELKEREAADRRREAESKAREAAEAKARGEDVKSEAAKNRGSKIAALERELGGKTAGDKALDTALFIPSVVAGVVAKPFVMAVNAGNRGINAVERTVAFGAGLVSGSVSGVSSMIGGVSGAVESVSKTVQVAFLKGADVLERNGWGVAAKLSDGLSKVPEVIGKAAGYGATASEFGEYVSSKIEGAEKGLTARADANVEKRNNRNDIASKLIHGKAREAYHAYKGEISEVAAFVESGIDPDELERRKRAAEKAAGVDAAAKDKPRREVDATALDGATEPRYVETRRGASKEEIEKIKGIVEGLKEEFTDLKLEVDKNNNITITGLSKAACLALDKMYEASGIEPPVDMTAGKQIDNYKAEMAKKAKTPEAEGAKGVEEPKLAEEKKEKRIAIDDMDGENPARKVQSSEDKTTATEKGTVRGLQAKWDVKGNRLDEDGRIIADRTEGAGSQPDLKDKIAALVEEAKNPEPFKAEGTAPATQIAGDEKGKPFVHPEIHAEAQKAVRDRSGAGGSKDRDVTYDEIEGMKQTMGMVLHGGDVQRESGIILTPAAADEVAAAAAGIRNSGGSLNRSGGGTPSAPAAAVSNANPQKSSGPAL